MAEVTKQVKAKVVKFEVYSLELTEDEAYAITAVFAKIGGNRDRSGRVHTDAIYSALAAAGFRYDSAGNEYYPKLYGGLNFKE